MPQSLSQVILHLVFSTRDRFPAINSSVRPRLHAYLASIARGRDANAYRVGGTEDHVHILCSLPRTLAQSDLVKDLKRESSKWMKQQGEMQERFCWQRGYGAFSLGRSQLEHAIQYVEGQEEHHRQVTFQEEYREFLDRYGVTYDERYVWD